MTMNFNNNNKRAADTLILIILIAFMMAFLTSCADRGVTNEDFNSLSKEELEVVREMRRSEVLENDEKKRNRKMFWKTNSGSPYYNTYDSYYKESQERKIRNKILYPDLYR